jgi:hypothetical protein
VVAYLNLVVNRLVDGISRELHLRILVYVCLMVFMNVTVTCRSQLLTTSLDIAISLLEQLVHRRWSRNPAVVLTSDFC